ncbi:uncharacterized protein C8Q71DRAFT_890845 [Rhodofomes roseus]|uniref:Uncharacterized protein n=1 Tax=Rhodofomes roseus TaxID=34475 RepID=A0ABQ8KR47_9APHY|nr:uncharacterized protein C8Q71DRAFT_890845 [Rhodofomes roseus]KAH9841102.1 hypothetical protein C8Q71DRAFT_890845 [Rhodofomes roseus]
MATSAPEEVPPPYAAAFMSEYCGGISVLINIFYFILYVTESVFAALRAFAISGYNWPAALLILAFGSITIWSNVYLIGKTTYYVESYGSVAACANTLDISGKSYHITVLSDALAMGITWWRTWGIKKAADDARISTPLTTVLLRDGSLYFAALAALSIAQTFMQIYDGDIDYLSYFLTPLPAICISRFLLNLRSSSGLSQLASATASQSETTPVGTLHFAHRVAGNLGNMLGSDDPDSWDSELEEEHSEDWTEATEMTNIQA